MTIINVIFCLLSLQSRFRCRC